MIASDSYLIPHDLSRVFIGFTGHRYEHFDEGVLHQLANFYPNATWIHGGAIGFDLQVDKIAREHHFSPIVIRPDYQKHLPHIAPILRNYQIVDQCNFLIAGWDGRRKGGTFRTVEYAEHKNIKVYVLKPNQRYHLVAIRGEMIEIAESRIVHES